MGAGGGGGVLHLCFGCTLQDSYVRVLVLVVAVHGPDRTCVFWHV